MMNVLIIADGDRIQIKEIALRVNQFTRLLAASLKNAGFDLVHNAYFDTIQTAIPSIESIIEWIITSPSECPFKPEWNGILIPPK